MYGFSFSIWFPLVLFGVVGCASPPQLPDESGASAPVQESSRSSRADAVYLIDQPDVSRLHDRLHSSGEHGPGPDYDSSPVIVKKVAPDYPDEALIRCLRGWVFMEFMISEKGTVEKLEVLAQDNSGLFGENAARAIEQWHFEPPLSGGEPVSRSATVPLHFEMPANCQEPTPELHEESLSGELIIPTWSDVEVDSGALVIFPNFRNAGAKSVGRPIHEQTWASGDDLVLDLNSLTNEIHFQRQHGNPDERSSLVPADALVVQLNPVLFSRDHGKVLDVFFTDASNRLLWPVYVDQEVTYSEKSSNLSELNDYSIDFPGAGFYWVELRPNADMTAINVALAQDVENVELLVRHVPPEFLGDFSE